MVGAIPVIVTARVTGVLYKLPKIFSVLPAVVSLYTSPTRIVKKSACVGKRFMLIFNVAAVTGTTPLIWLKYSVSMRFNWSIYLCSYATGASGRLGGVAMLVSTRYLRPSGLISILGLPSCQATPKVVDSILNAICRPLSLV